MACRPSLPYHTARQGSGSSTGAAEIAALLKDTYIRDAFFNQSRTGNKTRKTAANVCHRNVIFQRVALLERYIGIFKVMRKLLLDLDVLFGPFFADALIALFAVPAAQGFLVEGWGCNGVETW